ncbi:hypothetical protein BLS_004902 [Venturia inaequalis]|uniref:Uncharacterized protein n=1 Tax=Venturia inaequalis TaxID=5025 RepID=A0A8H3ZAT4_VENIN|nr:hypothetical protein BLS_004902 [Venturia inaequalis]KAE9974340.1 hypothetical protein EG328_003924 [Venturia inaequalis]KAE9992635.1 hypothetical protein EG327_008378 [Venturia inaequalis]RDI77452.1 hypothetical protein Vi05172_g12568 [Venturia inaequalis]
MAHSGKRAQSETRFDSDLMILDYTLFMATKALLEEQVLKHEEGVDENLSEHPLEMVNSFLHIFKNNHPSESVPDAIKLRLRLVKFTTLFGRRSTQSATTPSSADLEALRRTHRRRATEYWDSSSDGSFQEPAFQHRQSSERRSATQYRATTDSIALSDLVPMFIGLSAARSNMDMSTREITTQWMHLAGQFMLQAALEQCLLYGQCPTERLREIFSWGWKEDISTSWQDEQSVNDMFFDMDQYDEDGSRREVKGWREIKTGYFKMLKPTDGIDPLRHLKRVQGRYPLHDFESSLLLFLEALQLEQEEPFLTQLEKNNVPGMSPKEMASLKKRLRLPF